MKSYEEIIKKEGKDTKFYLPVIRLFEKEKRPLSIKEVAKYLNISYSAAKPRLHKLVKLNIMQGMKRGFYCLSREALNYTKIEKAKGKLVFVNGCIRIMGSSNGVWITIYNSKFGESVNGQYCKLCYTTQNKFIIRKSNQFAGSKLYFLISKSVGISISRKLLPQEVVSKLSSKVIPLKIGIYLEEWGISIKDLFSTESKEDGELAEELDKFGEIDKKNKFEDLKADILFTKKGLTIPIEITNTNPSSSGKFKQSRKSGVKSALIFSRLYFFIKWNFIHKSPTVLILNEDWESFKWLKKEQDFMKKFKCYILFTNFEEGWAKQASQEINRLTELSLFNKTTQLNSCSSSI